MSEFDELPETFDPSTHEGTDLKPIPPGWYQAQIVENSVEYAKNGNGTYLLAVFEILSSEHKGRRVYQNVTLQNVNQQAVEIQVMLFKPVMARTGIKVDKDGIYPDRNCVTQVRPPDYQPKRGRNALTPATAATPPREEAALAAPKSPAPSSPAPSSAPKPTALRGDAPWRS